MSARLLSGNKTMKIILFFFVFIVLVNNASAYTFTNIGGDFKIEYPAGWSYVEQPDGSDQTFTSQTGHASVRVAVEPSEGRSLDESVGDRIRFLLNTYGISPFSEKYVTVGGVKGKELMFYYYTTEKKEYKYRQILITSGDKSFVISAISQTSDFPFFSEDFDKIIDSFALLKPVITPKVTAGYTPVPTSTPVQEKGAPTISLHAERTSILVGEEVLLKLSILAPLGKPKMEFQIIIIPPSGMSVASQEFSETGGQYSQKGTIETGEARFVDIKLRANEAGDKDVEATVRYDFEDNKSNVNEVSKSQKIIVSAEATPTVTRGGEPSDGGSAVVGIIAIIAIIFTVYVIFNKATKTIKNKFGKGKAPTEYEAHAPEPEAEISEAQVVEEEPERIEPKIKKESAFDAEKRKQHSSLPPEDLDIETRNYLSSGVNTAISTLDAEIANAENDALQLQGAIKKDEDILGKLGTRLVNNEISDQTYNDLKNKYMRKISELKSKSTALESDAAKLKNIRSFIHEKGKYYT